MLDPSSSPTSTLAPSPCAPLSASPLWQQQRAYFEAQGPAAWASGAVPHYVTCNPYLARAFAEVVVGFAADRARVGGPGRRFLTIVELGAGAGRLGYNLVRALRGALDAAAAGWTPVYVLTDVAEATVAWWRAHPWLQPLFAAGLLDVARFDATADDELVLQVSGRRLAVDAPADELVVIANYVFDSLPHDVFEHTDGVRHEWQLSASAARFDPARGFDAIAPRWRRVPAVDGRYPSAWQAVLDGYRELDGVVTMPVGALTALGRLQAMSRGPVLVLSADKGGVHHGDVVDDRLPAFACHGSFSLPVNYHALAAWAAAGGGVLLHPEHRRRTLEVCALHLGEAAGPATVAAFDRAIAQRGPDDFYALKRVLVAHADALTLAELLSYLRLSGYDAKLLLDCAPALSRAVADADVGERADLALAIERVWDGYLPIGEAHDLPGTLARLCEQLGDDQQAAAFTAVSRALHGDRRRWADARPVASTAAPALDDPFDLISALATATHA